MKNRKPKYSLNQDRVSNIYSIFGGLGNEAYDPLETTQISFTPRYSKEELTNAYRNLWACRKVCDFLPRTMARGWGKVVIEKNEPLEKRVNKYLTANYLRNLYCRGQQLANLYGGSVVVRYIPDGRQYDEPVDTNFYSRQTSKQVGHIQYSRIYTPWEIQPCISEYDNPEAPEYYQYTFGVADNKTTYKIHSDRILRFKGAPTDYYTMKMNNGYEDSLLIPFIGTAMRYLTAINYVGASVTSFEFIVHKLKDLFQELENEETRNSLKERLAIAHQSLSSLRGLVLDLEEENVEIIARNYSGVKDIMEVLLNEMIAASGLTKPQFIQEHPSGLASTGESERLAEADTIRALQIEKWGDQISYDSQLHLWAQGYYGENWEWQWTNLFQQTPLEEAELKLKLAQAQHLTNNTAANPTSL